MAGRSVELRFWYKRARISSVKASPKGVFLTCFPQSCFTYEPHPAFQESLKPHCKTFYLIHQGLARMLQQRHCLHRNYLLENRSILAMPVQETIRPPNYTTAITLGHFPKLATCTAPFSKAVYSELGITSAPQPKLSISARSPVLLLVFEAHFSGSYSKKGQF